MRLSTRATYGLRLMIELGRSYGTGVVLLKDIAGREGISEKYLSQIVIPLKAAGVLNAYRGSRGGYRLARPPAEITIRQIVEPLGGDLKVCDAPGRRGLAQSASDAVVVDLCGGIESLLKKHLEGMNLSQLVRMRNEKKESVSTYQI